MTKTIIMRICVWMFVALLLVAVLCYGIFGRSFSFGSADFSTSFSYPYSDGYESGSLTLAEGSDVTRIEVNWLSGDITIRYYDGDRIMATESAKRELAEHETMRYICRDGVLTIQYCASRQGGQMFTNMPSKNLELLVPASLSLKAMTVTNVSSSLQIEGAHASIEKLSIENVSGDMGLTDLIVEKLDVSTVNGSLTASGSFGGIKVEGVSGSTTLRLARLPESFSATSISGRISLTVPENNGFLATLDTVSGKITCPFADTSKNRVAIYKGGGVELDFETVSGSVSIDMDETLSAPVRQTLAPTPKPALKPTSSPAVQAPTEEGGNVGSGGRSF